MTRYPLTHPKGESWHAQIGEEAFRRLLWDFYSRVVQDDLLGPVFTKQVGPFPRGGWPVHMVRIESFWRAVLGGESNYTGQPGQAHIGLGISAAHFDRWLALWQQTLGEHLNEQQAAELYGRAARMRVYLERVAVGS